MKAIVQGGRNFWVLQREVHFTRHRSHHYTDTNKNLPRGGGLCLGGRRASRRAAPPEEGTSEGGTWQRSHHPKKFPGLHFGGRICNRKKPRRSVNDAANLFIRFACANVGSRLGVNSKRCPRCSRRLLRLVRRRDCRYTRSFLPPPRPAADGPVRPRAFPPHPAAAA